MSSMTETRQLSSRLRSVDFLRGAAALGVVVAHMLGQAPCSAAAPFWLRFLTYNARWGSLGVPLFFVISGFCIHLRWAKQYAERNYSDLDFVRFWKRRIHRLYPPYFAALCLAMAMVLVAYHLRMNVPLVTNYPQPRLRWMLMDFLAHLSMLHGFYPMFDVGGGNGLFWTLAREEYFYLLYFPLLACRRKWGLRRTLVSVFVTGILFQLLVNVTVPPSSPWRRFTLDNSAIVLWIQWCLGMVAVEAYFGIIRLPAWCRSIMLIPLVAIVIYFYGNYISLLVPTLWGIIFFIFMNFCVQREVTRQWSLHGPIEWISKVGIFSYSLYLIHDLPREVIVRFLSPFDSVHHPWRYLLNCGITFAAGCFAGFLFFLLVERRFLNSSSPADIANDSHPKSAPISEEAT